MKTKIRMCISFIKKNFSTYKRRELILNAVLVVSSLIFLSNGPKQMWDFKLIDSLYPISCVLLFIYSGSYLILSLLVPYNKKMIGLFRLMMMTWFSVLSAGQYIVTFYAVIVKSHNVWGTVVVSVCLGIALYIIREKQRMLYGGIEFICGVLAIYSIFQESKFELGEIPYTLEFSVKIAGGLYIMVRGQDNMVKALKGTKAGNWLAKRGIGG